LGLALPPSLGLVLELVLELELELVLELVLGLVLELELVLVLVLELEQYCSARAPHASTVIVESAPTYCGHVVMRRGGRHCYHGWQRHPL